MANIELALGKNRWLGLLSKSLDYNEQLGKTKAIENNKQQENM